MHFVTIGLGHTSVCVIDVFLFHLALNVSICLYDELLAFPSWLRYYPLYGLAEFDVYFILVC